MIDYDNICDPIVIANHYIGEEQESINDIISQMQKIINNYNIKNKRISIKNKIIVIGGHESFTILENNGHFPKDVNLDIDFHYPLIKKNDSIDHIDLFIYKNKDYTNNKITLHIDYIKYQIL
jgi:hypothetical protein